MSIIKQKSLHFTIFATPQDDLHANIFTCIRNRLGVPFFDWHSFSGKRGIVRFEGCFSTEKGQEIIAKMTNGNPFVFAIEGTECQIIYGNLKGRAPVFMPNAYHNSLATGWWPGTLRHGFWLNEWYSLDAKYTPHQNTIDFIQEGTGFDLRRLPDFLNTILQITALDDYAPQISYNPDYKTVSFMLNGEVEKCDHRVVIEVWETKEMFCRTLVDMSSGTDYVTLEATFAPERLGFDLYKKVGVHWKLLASVNHTLVRQISLQIGLITGKLVVNKGKTTEEHDIVSYDNSKPANDSLDEPWRVSENERIRLNKAAEIRDLGSIFVRNVGKESRDQLQEIIRNEIFRDAKDTLYVWDPYLDKSVLTELLIKSISLPSLRLKLILSEPGKKQGEDENDDTPDAIPSGFTRCAEMFAFIRQNEDYKLANLEIRNWFRADQPAFHDRFILTEKAVWHLGSSLKDLGNYHSTIYRLPEELAKQVRQEFEHAWAGDFGVSKPYGFSVAPSFQWLRSKEGVVEK